MRRVAAVLALMLVMLVAGTARAGGPVAKVTGDGTYHDWLSISVAAHASDPAKGDFQATWGSLGSMQGTVTCVVIDGQDAWIAGMLTSVSVPPHEGMTWQGFYLWVHDAGQPSEAATDTFQNAIVGSSGTIPRSHFEGWCLAKKAPPTVMLSVTSGNLKIHEE